MLVFDAVERDLEALGDLAAGDGLKATALALASALDHPGSSPTSKAMVARELREVMDRLRELAPPRTKKDGIDDLADKRAARRARVTGASA